MEVSSSIVEKFRLSRRSQKAEPHKNQRLLLLRPLVCFTLLVVSGCCCLAHSLLLPSPAAPRLLLLLLPHHPIVVCFCVPSSSLPLPVAVRGIVSSQREPWLAVRALEYRGTRGIYLGVARLLPRARDNPW